MRLINLFNLTIKQQLFDSKYLIKKYVDLRKFQEWEIMVNKFYTQASKVIYGFSCQTS
jgi:hypothetical protein